MKDLNTLSKEAGLLRLNLENGLINVKELIQFLAKVEKSNAPPSGKKENEKRFERQLSKLGNTTSKRRG
jgi:hypothetical protein